MSIDINRLRVAAQRTREDLGFSGTNYPDIRILLDFVETAISQYEEQNKNGLAMAGSLPQFQPR